MYDTHVHTTFSPDSNLKTSDILLKSEAEGLGIIITDHYEFTVDPGIYTFRPQKYFEEFIPLRSDKLLIGVELGLNLFCQEEIHAFIKDYPFDYLIGSVHQVDEIEVSEENYFKDLSLKEAYEKYLSYILKC
jgi:histidinol-phosphatase (PHP family)